MPATIDVDVSRPMAASAVSIWAVLEDLRRLPEWLAFSRAVESVSGPAAAGASYTVKPHKWFEPTTHWTIIETEPLVRQIHTSEMPQISGVRSVIELSQTEEGLTARAHWTGTPKGMAKLMRPMFQRRITENWQRSLEQLDRLSRSAEEKAA
jgi:hypothetical protein